MKNKFKIYFLTFFSLFILFSFSFCFNSYASNSNLPNFKNYVSNDDGTEKFYHVTFNESHNSDSSDDYYELIILSYIPKIILYDKSLECVRIPIDKLSNDLYMSKYQYKPSVDSDWVHILSGYRAFAVEYGLTADTYFDGTFFDKITVYSNYDIIVSSDGFNFFQKPRTLALATQTIPATIRAGVLKQVVYLMPCLISLVIGLIAFRKAWLWLKMQLLN